MNPLRYVQQCRVSQSEGLGNSKRHLEMVIENLRIYLSVKGGNHFEARTEFLKDPDGDGTLITASTVFVRMGHMPVGEADLHAFPGIEKCNRGHTADWDAALANA